MRKNYSWMGILLIIGLTLTACGPKAGAPKAGEAKAENMLAMLPVNSQGAIFVDVKRAMATSFVKEAIAKDENGQKMQEFIDGTGINPQEDLYFMAIGVAAADEEGKQGGAAVLNMKLDKGKILEFMKQKAEESEKTIMETDYNGVTLYEMEDDKEKMYLAFLDDANISIGNKAAVHGIIDVYQKKMDSILKNEDLQKLLNTSNKNAMVWGAMLVPEESMEKATSSNPMLSSLNSVRAVSMFFDYANENLQFEILAMSDDAQKNSQVAEFLTGIKGLGGMMAGEKPEIGQILNSISITSTEDHVKISATIPESLIKTIMEKEMSKDTEEDIEQ
jgi:hypothetical protein